jgi:hypothetical protein
MYGLVAHDAHAQHDGRFVHQCENTVNNSLRATRIRCFLGTILAFQRGSVIAGSGLPVAGRHIASGAECEYCFREQAHKDLAIDEFTGKARP